MKFKNTYDAFLGTGLVGYKGILYTALEGLKYNDIYAVRTQLQNLSTRLERFLTSTGLYVSIKSLPTMHRKIDHYSRLLSNTQVLSFNAKMKVEDFLYNLLSAFGRLAEFCSFMLSVGF